MNVISSPLARHPQICLPHDEGSVFTFPESQTIVRFQRAILSALSKARAGTVIPISYQGVVLTASCQAATLGKALLEIVRGTFPDRFLTVHDPDGTNDWDADAALKKLSTKPEEKLVCTWHGPEGTTRLVGAVHPQIEATYRFVCAEFEVHGGATARSFAEKEGISIQAASNRMSSTSKLGLIYRAEETSVEGGGKQHVYVPIE